MTLAGLVLLVAGGAVTWRCARGGGPYRAGPWPGLTPRGAGVLLGCALLLAGGQLIVGSPRAPLPDLPVIAAAALAPLALAARLARIPGAASAVCGAYLLPRSLLSLVDPALEPPPLLLVPALAFDIALWLRASKARPVRAALGGALFGALVAALQPPLAALLGADPAIWSGTDFMAAVGVCVAVCAVLGLIVAAPRPQRPRSPRSQQPR